MKINKKFVLFVSAVVLAVAAMLFVILRKDTGGVVFAKPLTATMSIDVETLTPVGTVTAEQFQKMRQDKEKTINTVKNKATITIAYKNNTDKKLENVKIRFKEIKTTDSNNLILYGDIGINSYKIDDKRNIIFNVSGLGPKAVGTATIIVWAQREGSAEYEAEILSGSLNAKSNNVTITAK